MTVSKRVSEILSYAHYQGFYFIFYGGYIPFLLYFPIYLKHIGLNAAQVGIISGIRPIFQSIGAPLLVLFGDRLQSRKLLFIISSLIGIVKLICLFLLLKPSHQQCVVTTVEYSNSTRIVSKNAYVIHHMLSKREVMHDWATEGKNHSDGLSEENTHRNNKERRLNYPTNVLLDYNGEHMAVRWDSNDGNAVKNGSNITYGMNKQESMGSQQNKTRFKYNTTKPVYTNVNESNLSETEYRIVNDENEINRLYYSMLVVALVTDIYDATMFTLVDHSCIDHQGREKYGFSRLWGTLGWGIMAPIMTMAMHGAPHELCGRIVDTYHYVFIFAIVFFNISLLIGSHLDLDASFSDKKVRKVHGTRSNFHYGMFLIVFAYAGFCNGFLFTFVNWFIDSIGGSSEVMGTATACKCVVDVILFFLLRKVLHYLGYVLSVSIGLVGHIAVFFVLSRITSAWWVVLVEFIHAIFYGLLVSSCAYFLDESVPTGSNIQLQGKFLLLAITLGLINEWNAQSNCFDCI